MRPSEPGTAMTPTPTTSQADSSESRRDPRALRRGGCIIGWCGLLAALSTGCTQSPQCAELGDCGGNPVGDWALSTNHPSCSEDLYTPPTDTRLDHGDQPAARTPPAEEALYDWCDLLVTNGGAKVATIEPTFSYENGTIGTAFIHYDPIGANGSGTYAASLTRTGRYTIPFPTLCIRQFGATGDVCNKLQTQLTATSAHKDILCQPDPADPSRLHLPVRRRRAKRWLGRVPDGEQQHARSCDEREISGLQPRGGLSAEGHLLQSQRQSAAHRH